MAVTDISFESASELFVTEVQQQYQNMRSFAGAVLERHGGLGDTMNFPVGDVGEMEETGFGGGDIPVNDLNETNVPISVGNFHFKTTIGGGEKTLFSYDKITENAREHALAGARQLDKLLLDAIFVQNGGISRFASIDTTIGSTETLNVAKLSLANDLLLAEGIPMRVNKNILLPALSHAGLRNDPLYTSWDFNLKRPLMEDLMQGFLNIAFFNVGDKGINKIPRTGTGTVADPFLYDIPILAEDSCRIVFNRELQSVIVHNQFQDRWELITSLTARGGVIQTTGIKIIKVKVVVTP